MAGKITDMSKIKQVLIMHRQGHSNRSIARMVGMNKCTVNECIRKPGEVLMTDFAGDRMSYTDIETGERIRCEIFVGTMAYSDYAYAVAVPSQKAEDFIHTIRMCLEYLEGVITCLSNNDFAEEHGGDVTPRNHENTRGAASFK